VAYTISAINPIFLAKNDKHYKIEVLGASNEAWKTAMSVLCSICPHLNKRDYKFFTDYTGRALSGEKAEKTILCLRQLLLKRCTYTEFVLKDETIEAEPWLWELLEEIYEMLCWSDGFIVR